MTAQELMERTAKIPIKILGDQMEKSSSAFIEKLIPNYEEFWRIFVFPYRKKNSIWLNPELPRNHEAVCIYNYSIFRSSLRVHRFSRIAENEFEISGEISTDTFDDWLIWLVACYDRIMHFGGAFAAAFVERSNKILLDINQWKSEWKVFKTHFPDIDQQLTKQREEIDQLRSYAVHSAKFPGYINLIPKQKYLSRLGYWSVFRKYVDEKPKRELRKLVDRFSFLKMKTEDYFKFINNLWREIIDNEKPNGPVLNGEIINDIILRNKDSDNVLHVILGQRDETLEPSALLVSGNTMSSGSFDRD